MSSNSVELDNPYGSYTPSLPTAVVFIVIFSLSSMLFLYQILSVRPRRMLWMLVFPICGFIEVLGWAGRLWSHFALLGDGFIMQICCLTIGPTFISAGLYMLLGVVIQRIAPQHSWLSGKWFKIVFVVADVISLVIQAVGGAMAASAETGSGADQGGKIMLGGIVVQLAVMLCYSAYGAAWAFKSRTEIHGTIHSVAGGHGISRAMAGMALCSLCIIIRGFYRSVELGDGFRGPIATNQPLFLLDAIPVSIAMLVVNAIPPIQHLSCLFEDSQARTDSTKNLHMAEQGVQAAKMSSVGTLVGIESSKGN